MSSSAPVSLNARRNRSCGTIPPEAVFYPNFKKEFRSPGWCCIAWANGDGTHASKYRPATKKANGDGRDEFMKEGQALPQEAVGL